MSDSRFDTVLDTVLDTALDARSLIEASAGTGKTYALAGLFARAVIGGGLRVPQILAVTYTEAATQQLRERVRLRLKRAAELAAQWTDGAPPRRDGDDAQTALLRRLLHEALHRDDATHDGADRIGEHAPRESLTALRLRLARAQRDIDRAAIWTIHGFCQRVLGEHALDTGQPLAPCTIEPANRASRRRLAVALWRAFNADADAAEFLQRAFGDPDGLARSLRDLLAPEPLLPPPPRTLPEDPRPALLHAWRTLLAALAEHGAQARADITRAIDGKVLKSNEYRTEHVESLWAWLDTCSADSPPAQCHEKLAKYTPGTLQKGTLKKMAGRTPQAPLFPIIGDFIAALEAVAPWREARELQWLHALRREALDRDRTRKQAFNVRDYDDLIGAVHDALKDDPARIRLAGLLRAQYPLVLVDEFQDTDARQWAIFSTLFAQGGLVLVGDPKQAIYRFRGGDVHTYLQARATAAQAPALLRNFRSRPSVLAVTNALFEHAPPQSLGTGIAFTGSTPGDKAADADYLLDGVPAPALTFHAVPPTRDDQGNDKDWLKPESIDIAARLCAREIHDALLSARTGRAQRRDGNALRALEPRDCAVLVRDHAQATAVRAALADVGVPAVATGKRSLFASDEARQLLTLLLALHAPFDDRRLRAALATPLLGFDAAALGALDDNSEALRHWQQTFQDWRTRWEQHGPQAMLAHAVAQHAASLLPLGDGERRLTYLLQLGEAMQEARASRLGSQGQLDWLCAAIDTADPDDEAQLPRLESDADRVQILTLHKSKGLEFPLVLLPFVGIGRGGGSQSKFVICQHDGQRVRQWKTAHAYPGAPTWDEACERGAAEDRAEDMRLLYVGLTRARDALWLCGGALAGHAETALSRLLGGNRPQARLIDALGPHLKLRHGLPADDHARLPPAAVVVVPAARRAQRRLPRDWWIHSFSQLHRQQAQGVQALVEEAPADDERPLAITIDAVPRDLRFSGARFGNALHHALEHVDFAAWRDNHGERPPEGQEAVLIAALQSQDCREPDFADGLRALAPLVARTLNAPLPEGGCLWQLPASARVAELEFHFTLGGTGAGALLALLHRHGVAAARRDFGVWSNLSGLMNGKIDLTYRVDGRVYVLDYKSNWLPDYDQATLAQAMVANEYDLQALLYAVAVHRWLRMRRGADYDFDRDFGGVRYLFCRGLGPDDSDPRDCARGIVVPALPRALIEAVDTLLAASMRDAT